MTKIVWLLPCLFVRVGHRARGITYALVQAAVDLARDQGASAIGRLATRRVRPPLR